MVARASRSLMRVREGPHKRGVARDGLTVGRRAAGLARDAGSPHESTRVHSGVDRFDADGIGILGPESANPPTPLPPEKTLYPPSRKGRDGERATPSRRIVCGASSWAPPCLSARRT